VPQEAEHKTGEGVVLLNRQGLAGFPGHPVKRRGAVHAAVFVHRHGEIVPVPFNTFKKILESGVRVDKQSSPKLKYLYQSRFFQNQSFERTP
jgi:hypothetical protein